MSWSRWFLSLETVCHDCGEDFYCCYLTRDYWHTELWSVEVLQWQWDNVCPAETGAGSTRMSHSGYNIITDMRHHSAVLSGFFFNIIIDMIVSDIWIWSAGNDCSSIIMLEKMIRVILAIRTCSELTHDWFLELYSEQGPAFDKFDSLIE